MLPQLKTERFLLQQIVPGDQPFIFEGLSHPKVIPHYGVQYKTLDETTAQMQYYSQLQKDGSGGWWKIVDLHTLVKLGAIGYNNHSLAHQKCEIGYWLLPQFWGNGIIAEALQEMISYLFAEVKIHRIEALIEAENKASATVVAKAGFTLEGTLRDYELKSDRYITLQIYSLLATERNGR